MEVPNPLNQTTHDHQENNLINLVFSWSIQQLLNKDLYKNKVKEIPRQFSSTSEYFNSFIHPLIEETHADIYSCITQVAKAPATQILSVQRIMESNMLYRIATIEGDEKETYKPMVGDLFAITDAPPKIIDDLLRPGRPFLMASVESRDSSIIIIRSSRPLDFEQQEEENTKLFAVFFINMITNVRIWKALISGDSVRNLNIINNILQIDSHSQESCDQSSPSGNSSNADHAKKILNSFNLNESQEEAILRCISSEEHISNNFKLIWGPPGTGKTKTVASLLFVLLKTNRRTLTCAPTNIAVVEVASRLLKLVKESIHNESIQYETYGLGDIVLFGNEDRMKISDHVELIDIFLDHRARMLLKCFAPFSGWRHCLESMIGLLEEPKKQYHYYLIENKNTDRTQIVTFEEFLRKTLKSNGDGLKLCMKVLYTHLPTSFISLQIVKKMITARQWLDSISSMLEGFKVAQEEVRRIMISCLQVLRSLSSLFIPPTIFNDQATLSTIKKFCLINACLIFSTASSSVRLQTPGMSPIDFLLIDEAAQLKECESAIPLQLPGLLHAILIGDEKQLPAMVKSKISEEAGFGRSLFERMVVLGHDKHLLNTQYRMHPSISIFPKNEFYDGQILDAPNVSHKSYEKNFLPGKMYGAFSFINVEYGKEELGDNQSSKNMVEVAVVSDLVERLFRESVTKKQKISVGVISPYNAQVFTLQETLKGKYPKEENKFFSLNVRSVDGYQGGEDDVIIISTVRCNRTGSIGFLSNRQRANVALTRARYHLWVLGSAATLSKSGSVWDKLVTSAKDRNCFFDANDDRSLAKATILALLMLNQVDNLLDVGSKFFMNTRWKVFYSNEFWKSLAEIQENEAQNNVLLLLEKLSLGWRDPISEKQSNYFSGVSSQMLQVYDVNGVYKLVWAVDIINENSTRLQVLKVWDISPLFKLATVTMHVEKMLTQYSEQNIIYCRTNRIEGNINVPVSWYEDSHDEHFLSSELASLRLTGEPDACESDMLALATTNRTITPVHIGLSPNVSLAGSQLVTTTTTLLVDQVAKAHQISLDMLDCESIEDMKRLAINLREICCMMVASTEEGEQRAA